MSNPYINGAFFSRLETQALRLKNDLIGFFGGKHRTDKYGQTVEFADYREYMLGDDIRRIDWNLYSRFEKYYIRLFTDERQMAVNIYIDCSASMGKDLPQKGQYAVALGAGLGFLAVHSMDKVAFKPIHERQADDSGGTIVGKSAFFRAVRKLESINFAGDSYLSEAIVGSAEKGSRDGLTVIISDFLTDNDWKRAVDFLRYKGRQVLLVQVLAKEEAAPAYTGRVNLIDSEALDMEDPRNMKMKINSGHYRAYAQALNAIKEDIRGYCKRRRADFVSVCTDTPIEKAIFRELMKIGVLE